MSNICCLVFKTYHLLVNLSTYKNVYDDNEYIESCVHTLVRIEILIYN